VYLKGRFRNSLLFGPRAAVYYFLVHSRAEDKIMIGTFVSQVSMAENKICLNSLFVACGFILLPSELFRILISCRIVNNLNSEV